MKKYRFQMYSFLGIQIERQKVPRMKNQQIQVEYWIFYPTTSYNKKINIKIIRNFFVQIWLTPTNSEEFKEQNRKKIKIMLINNMYPQYFLNLCIKSNKKKGNNTSYPFPKKSDLLQVSFNYYFIQLIESFWL